MGDQELITGLSVIAAGLMIAGAAVGSGVGVGQVAAKFLEGSARNPVEAPNLQVKAFIMAGTLDAVPMIAVGIAMLLLFANPFLEN